MKLIYTAGPITADTPSERLRNCMRAWHYAMRIWKKGHGVVCPQMNTFFMDSTDIDYETFMNADFEMIKRGCDAILMLPGWKESKGSTMEHELAEELGLPIFYAQPARGDRGMDSLYDFLREKELVDAVH